MQPQALRLRKYGRILFSTHQPPRPRARKERGYISFSHEAERRDFIALTILLPKKSAQCHRRPYETREKVQKIYPT